MKNHECNKCKKPIMWVTTVSGKLIDLDTEKHEVYIQDQKGNWGKVKAHYSHIDTCGNK